MIRFHIGIGASVDVKICNNKTYINFTIINTGLFYNYSANSQQSYERHNKNTETIQNLDDFFKNAEICTGKHSKELDKFIDSISDRYTYVLLNNYQKPKLKINKNIQLSVPVSLKTAFGKAKAVIKDHITVTVPVRAFFDQSGS